MGLAVPVVKGLCSASADIRSSRFFFFLLLCQQVVVILLGAAQANPCLCLVQEIRPVHQLLQVPDDHLGSGCFLPSAWLESWANNADSPGHIDNGQLLCEHGKLKLDKPGVMKYISKAAWEALVVSRIQPPLLILFCCCGHGRWGYSC